MNEQQKLKFDNLSQLIMKDVMIFGQSGELLTKLDPETDEVVIYYKPYGQSEFIKVK